GGRYALLPLVSPAGATPTAAAGSSRAARQRCILPSSSARCSRATWGRALFQKVCPLGFLQWTPTLAPQSGQATSSAGCRGHSSPQERQITGPVMLLPGAWLQAAPCGALRGRRVLLCCGPFQ